jgi:hypothetical protein
MPDPASKPAAPPVRADEASIATQASYCGDNLPRLGKMPDACVDLIYIDLPFNPNRNTDTAAATRPGSST